MGVKDAVLRTAVSKTIDYVFEDPETRLPKIMDAVNKVAPDDLFPAQRKTVTNVVKTRNNWYEFILRMTRLQPGYAQKLAKKFVLDANFEAWPQQQASRAQYGCNIPWAILLDPTSACNLRCTGCWAADYGHSLNLTYDKIDSIIEQGKALGTHIYIYTGGEPLVRKEDLIRLCEKHQDCAFLTFTNGTLIDEQFCRDIARVANFVPAISVEGFEAATDARRGQGTYAKVVRAMELMKEHGLAFGVSCCYTRENYASIASEEFFDWMIDQGALFAWFFTYMPIGKGAPTELMATAEQREGMYHFIRDMRSKKPFFTMDFWNDGEFVGGCIAGGRRYLHINANGDVEPCVFAHYSDSNIREKPLLDALRGPLFMGYYEAQPFSANLLRPCPILDNKGALARIVEATGAKPTDLKDAESAQDVCDKCIETIDAWAPVAEKLWYDETDPRREIRMAGTSGMDEMDFAKFERMGRSLIAEMEAGTLQ